MVPGAANGVPDKKSVGQRCAIMGADRSDREHLLTAPDQQHRLAKHMPEQHAAIWNG
jgi:hypothetical protein